MSEKVPVSCAVCASSACRVLFEPWSKVTDPASLYGSSDAILGTQRIVRCESCGLVYENPRYPESIILKGYRQASGGGHDSQYEMRVDNFHRTLTKLREHLPAPRARILDVGSAGGAFLEAATRFGYEAWGLEPSKDLTQRAVARGLKAKEGTLADHGLAEQSFDMICMWDVIEHLVDPALALRQIHALLKPGGILLVNCPDIGTWQAKIFGRRFWWFMSVHLHHFSRRTLAEICRRNGFESFCFRRYTNALRLGYLLDLATQFRLPLVGLVKTVLPKAILDLLIPYYASQTTMLARKLETDSRQ